VRAGHDLTHAASLPLSVAQARAGRTCAGEDELRVVYGEVRRQGRWMA